MQSPITLTSLNLKSKTKNVPLSDVFRLLLEFHCRIVVSAVACFIELNPQLCPHPLQKKGVGYLSNNLDM